LLAASDAEQTVWEDVTVVPGKLFVVGDPKQSIYRFRRADVELYRRVCDLLVRGGARPVKLTTSFRSVPSIQRLVNAAFEPIMAPAGYVPLMPHREECAGQPSVVVLPVPEPYAG